MFRLLWLLSVGMSMSAPTDEFRSFVSEGELSLSDDGPLMGIVPGGYPAHGTQPHGNIFYQLMENHADYKAFNQYIKQGTTIKGLMFNIYDKHMKDAASRLFQLLHTAYIAGYSDKLFNFDEFNEDLVTYATQVSMLYNTKHVDVASFLPPFITKPNFFVNGETIMKALKISHYVNNNIDFTDEAIVDQYNKIYDRIVINTNYSGWNLPETESEDFKLNYFREDISLNSYYYGVHLMYPYWMFRHELYEMNSGSDEHYYFIHQQLAARLHLEKQHLRQENNNLKSDINKFHPYLIHENGLPFPSRSSIVGNWSEDRDRIQSIDIAIKECMSRGLIVMDNKSPIKLTADNYVKLLTRLIRGNFEVGRNAQVIRSIFGYGGNGYPIDEYNPAPSVLHHPQTTLRDPIYWYMIQHVLNYFTEYKESIDPLNLRDYAHKRFEIIDADIPKITTYFDYYQFNINRAINKKESLEEEKPLTITARQKRLKHSKFILNFTVDCVGMKDAVVRLFLGPPCTDNCWEEYSNFFELDKFLVTFDEGLNTLTWSPTTSRKLSSDEYYNLEGSSHQKDKMNNYNMFKFPENLIIPRGLETGLNLTLFIMITPPSEFMEDSYSVNKFFADIKNDLDKNPPGFPFHRPAIDYYDDAPNYKFYNITIYHKRNNIPKNGYFSPHLY